MSYADALADLLRSLDGRMTFTMTDPERYKRAHARREAEGFMPPQPQSPEEESELRQRVRESLATPGGWLPYNGAGELELINSEIELLREQRRKERLTAAKQAVAESLYDVAMHEPRSIEIAADAIENLVRVVMEESK